MLTRLQRDGLKGVADVAFKLAGGNPACALISRITRIATFSDYINISFDDRSVPLDVAVDVDRYNLERGGEPWLIRAAAQLLGFMLVRAPLADAASDDVTGLLAAAKETTEAVAAGWAARADGVYSSEEIREIEKQIDEAVVSLLAFKAAVLATADIQSENQSALAQSSRNPRVKP